jgi:uncharacterized protein (TIGR02145 family)
MKTLKTHLSALAILVISAIAVTSCKENEDDAVGIVPQVETSEAQYITYNSATMGGSITSDGGSEIIAKGICFGTNPNPTIQGDTTNQGAGIDGFEIELTDLIPNTTYHARAYATNKIGTNYGEEVSFMTESGFPIVTVEMSGLYYKRALATLKIMWSGASPITGSGLVYSSEHAVPDISDILWPSSSTAEVVERQLTELTPGTLYYVRAYAQNSQGTAYSDVVAFNTKSANPVTDVDGNVYQMVVIGDQAWMAENLRVTKYNNSDAIGTTTNDVSGEASPKYQWSYNNNDANAPTYGRYYTYFAMTDSRKVCPDGTHFPSLEEMTTMFAVNGTNGGKYKLTGTTVWLTPNTGATNTLGFNAPGAGQRDQNSAFYGYQESAMYMTSTPNANDATRFYGTYISYDNTPVTTTEWFVKRAGFSVRCVAD